MLTTILLTGSLLQTVTAKDPECKEVLKQMDESHAKEGRERLYMENLPNGVLIIYGTGPQDEYIYGSVFVLIDEGVEKTVGKTFEFKGVCRAVDGQEVSYFTTKIKNQ